jgi:L-alanine-DL-glutamate epimerase-like enolase superfamily enzyme
VPEATIESVRAVPWNVELTEPFGIATGAQFVAENVLVEVRLTDGTSGIGEAAPFPAVNGETQAHALAAVERAGASLVGKDPRRWRRLGADLKEITAGTPSALAGLEMAVLDAWLRHAGVSLWTFFGAAETSLETDITIVTGTAARARDAAERAVASGFRTLKIKVGGAPLEHDVERVDAIALAAPDARLVLDANGSMTAEAAVDLVDRIGKERVALFEQPTAADDYDGLRAVRKRTRVPVAADESARSASDVVALAHARAIDVVNVKITKSGLAEACDMCAVARAAGLGLMIGGMVETPLAMTVSACLAAGHGGFAFVDLDTPFFMKEMPTEGGWGGGGNDRRKPIIDVANIAGGHGVRLAPRRSA